MSECGEFKILKPAKATATIEIKGKYITVTPSASGGWSNQYGLIRYDKKMPFYRRVLENFLRIKK